MNQKLKAKIIESLSSVVPISLIVFVLCLTITPIPLDTLMLFLAGAALLVVGMGFFTLGADMSMMEIGHQMGSNMVKSKNLSFIVLCCFIIGIIVTIAEPDLQVLAGQTPAVPDMTLILTVAIGVGIFLVLAFLRILFHLRLSWLLIGFYSIVFLLSIFVPKEFLAVAFDSGGVTTGPITVPFIMALGLGLTSIRSDKSAEDDSFGLISLCSIGPIASVLILGMIYNPSGGSYAPLKIPQLSSTRDLWIAFGNALPEYFKEMVFALLPILLFFLLFQIFSLKLHKRSVIKIMVGLSYTLIGLTLFMAGVNVGFMPAGYYIGMQLMGLPYSWIIIPIGMLIGYYIVKAEPAVAVLNKQVEDITKGAISQKMMMTCLSIGMSVSLGLSMTRILTGINLMWFVVPGYAIALGLTFVVPHIFTAIAFDSGGVASGPMTATFLLPFAMGACESIGGNILTDAFGTVAMVAMTPLFTIQGLGLIYKLKMRHTSTVATAQLELVDELVDYEEVEK